MSKSNVDVIAVAILIAASAVYSAAKKLESWDAFSERSLVVQRVLLGPALRVVSSLPMCYTRN